MAHGAVIEEFPFAQGQNEGTEKAVLPMGQFSYLQNARFRKNGRLGKRNGYSSKPATDGTGAALGNGNGRISCIGPNFCVVDDRFYLRNTVADTWAPPPGGIDSGAFGSTRLTGRFPQFMPAPVFETLTVQSDTNLGGYTGTALPSTGGLTYALGYIWTACIFYDRQALSWVVRVNATDPTTGLTVWRKDVLPNASPAVTDRPQVTIIATGDRNTVAVIYDVFTAGTKSGIAARSLTSLAGGFGAEVSFSCIQYAVNYDPSVASSILFVYALTGSPATYTIMRVNPTTFVPIASASYALGGAKTLLSCFGNSAGNVWVGFTDAGLFSHAYDSTLTLTAASANIAGAFAANSAAGPLMFAARSNTEVAVLSAAVNVTGINVIEHATTGAINGLMTQYNCQAISQPFTIGSQVFVWVRHLADSQLGVATLVRVPTNAEMGGLALSPFIRSFPIEATLDDWDVDAPIGALTSGVTFPTPVSTELGYVALINYTRRSLVVTGSPVLERGFLVVPVRHRSEGLRYAPSCVVGCSGKQFVAGAQPMWVDSLGETEAGFIQAPVSTAATSTAGGGNLTVNSNYAHTAIFESLDASGLVERSAPAEPATFSTGANQTALVQFSNLQLGKRVVRLKLYRTLANGSIFYLVGSVDSSPGMNLANVNFTDTYADTDIVQNEILYVNVGQELSASQFPACSFANVGGNRLWCAGGFNSRTWHASKLFLPRQCAEFADDDAFRGTLPGAITGSAWCDQQVFFTQTSIHVVSGDGPDGSGNGFFTSTQLPFQVGCIDWRSVIATELGIFFQSARGLYLLPRGFGEPQAMDQVLDTITTYPVITSVRANFDSEGGADNSEQVVQWTAVTDESATSGVVITFDLAYRAFYIDTFNVTTPPVFQAGWQGDSVQSPALSTSTHPFRVRSSGFDDAGLEIDMKGTTGDMRFWGTLAHGIVNRVGFLGELRSACVFEVKNKTDKGESFWKERQFTLVAGDAQVGDATYIETPLGNDEQRDITSLRTSFHESSTNEGFAPFGLYIERQKENQGWRLIPPRARVNVRADAILTESGAEVLTTEDGEQLITEDGS